MTLLLILQLFATFFVIGMFTFGGGYAMLSLIQGQVVVSHEWISQSTFTDIVAISQMTPGPIGINCATYVGYDVLMKATGSHFLGVLGSFTATSAIVLPSFIIVLALVKFYVKFHGNTIFESVMSWIRPSVVGLIHNPHVQCLLGRHANVFASGHEHCHGKLPGLEKLGAVRGGNGRVNVLQSRPYTDNRGRRSAWVPDLLAWRPAQHLLFSGRRILPWCVIAYLSAK